MKNKLAYYVYIENFNSGKIEKYNVLSDHIVENIKKRTKKLDDKQTFAEEVKSILRYYFWSKCEWEIVLTDWPTHIDVAEVTRLRKELYEYFGRWHREPYSIDVQLRVAEKIDVFDQIMLNWDIFIDYLWNNLRGGSWYMKKLFVVSDVHSFYSEMKLALDKAGFDENNENHWLIVCGDAFDRGEESVEMLHYLMSLDRKVLIRGNHDTLLEDCCKRGIAYLHDIRNGTAKTINDIGCAVEGNDFEKCCELTLMKTQVYRDTLINYLETKNYIFVHSWIPTICEGISKPWHRYDRVDRYNEDWRSASTRDWDNAMWGNPFEMAELGLNQTGKVIVFGHWHCSTGWSKAENRSEFESDAKWDIYRDEINNIIGIDRCTAHTKEVNVLVLEDEFLGE